MLKRITIFLAALLCAACQTSTPAGTGTESISATYIAIAQASYEDSLLAAREFALAVKDFLAAPDEAGLERAREAWKAARIPYMQTEVFRYGNPLVEEWAFWVHGWPINAGMIDYASPDEASFFGNNPYQSANIIGSEILEDSAGSIDVANISAELLAETLHQIGGIESNVATGYHVIEFLLWGEAADARGQRPATDYSLQNCSNHHCGRRREYLLAVTDLLVADLREMHESWQEGQWAYLEFSNRPDQEVLAVMLGAMGSLAYGEMAGERIRRSMLSQRPADIHDGFSGNNHHSLIHNARGISNLYLGHYRRSSGELLRGASLAALVDQRSPGLGVEMLARIESTELALQAVSQAAEAAGSFNTLILSGQEEDRALLMRAVNALMEETRTIELIIELFGLQNVQIRGSDSLNL